MRCGRQKGVVWQHLQTSEGQGKSRKENNYLELIVQPIVAGGYVPPPQLQFYLQGDALNAYIAHSN